MSKLFLSMGFSICGLCFSILILLMYLDKKKSKITSSGLFSSLLIFTIILLVLEIGYISSMTGDKVSILTSILCRTYLIGILAWMISFVDYIIVVGTDFVTDDKKREKIRRNYLIMLIGVMFIASIGTCLVGIDYNITANVYSFGGNAVNFVYVVMLMMFLIIFLAILFNKLRYVKEQRLIIYFSFVFLIAIILLQLINGYDYNIQTFIFSLMMAMMYFTVENQDNKLITELEKSKEKAQISDRAKTEFLTSMSHDIRTPMNTILGFSEALLNERELTEEIVKRDTKNIHDAGVSLLDLINNILDISRIESDKEKVTLKEYDLQMLVFEINSIITSKINSKEITFSVNVDQELPKRYLGDYSKICKVIVNVLLNALNYTNYGKLTLDIHKKQDSPDFAFEIMISNTGHAMQEDTFQIEFEDFVKIDSELDNKVDSVLLGLIVAKRFVSMMSGEINFKNEVGRGTRYFITIPQKVVLEDKIGDVFENMSKDVPDERVLEIPDKRILVVDDNKINIKLAVRLLQGYKAKIDEANSGNECLEMIKNNNYDIIFLDHMMPEMDGVATLKALKTSGYKVPPVIALTANSYSGIREKYLDEGFDDYLGKPISYRELNKIMHRFFDVEE